MLYWWPVAKHLSEFLAAMPYFAAWKVYPGSKGSAKAYPCCEVQWDKETELLINKPTNGDIILWVDLWVNSNNVEPIEVYDLQYAAQMAVLNSLREWSDKLLHDVGLAVNVECPGIASAGTITRPSFGCRIILSLEWRKDRYARS